MVDEYVKVKYYSVILIKLEELFPFHYLIDEHVTDVSFTMVELNSQI